MKYGILKLTNSTEKKASSHKEQTGDGSGIHPSCLAKV
jgi:hypothetical protein